MRTALLLHGTGGSDNDYFWFEDTANYLRSVGYEVWWPLLPHTEKPNLDETSNFLATNMPTLTDESVIIGHSSACPVTLHLLASSHVTVRQVILVSGFYQSLNDDGYSDLMLPGEGFDFAAIRQHAQEILLINSDNDPWGCNDVEAKPVAVALNAPLITMPGQGHMGSGSFNQPYREFPLLKRLITP